MNVVPNRYELPLFMASRNILSKNRIDELKEYIAKKGELYFEKCKQDNVTMTRTHKKLRHLIGLEPSHLVECTLQPMEAAKDKRFNTKGNDWQLPPNLYDTTNVPFASKQGSLGTNWSKRALKPVATSQKHTKIREETKEKVHKPSINKKVGRQTNFFMISNARSVKATARSTISTLALNEREPLEPGPGAYECHNYEMAHNAHPVTKTVVPLPYKFYKSSIVPMQFDRFKLNRRLSFNPAPGRYELTFPRICGCRPLAQATGNQWSDKPKTKRKRGHGSRKKKLINKEHIPGNGHTWLFKNPPERIKFKFSVKEKQIAYMSLDSKYINMIRDPIRTPLSVWVHRPVKWPKVRFNAIIKRTLRKRLTNNAKIAFLSTCERFDPLESRGPVKTHEEYRAIRRSLPAALRMVNRKVMETPVWKIKPKVYDVFEQQRHIPKHENVKASFKFPPLPACNVLLSPDDAHPNADNLPGHHFKNYSIESYFKSETRTERRPTTRHSEYFPRIPRPSQNVSFTSQG